MKKTTKHKMSFGFVDNPELDALIDELGLIHSSFITPTIRLLIVQEFRMREFESINMDEVNRFHRNEFLKKLRNRKKRIKKDNSLDKDLLFFEP